MKTGLYQGRFLQTESMWEFSDSKHCGLPAHPESRDRGKGILMNSLGKVASALEKSAPNNSGNGVMGLGWNQHRSSTTALPVLILLRASGGTPCPEPLNPAPSQQPLPPLPSGPIPPHFPSPISLPHPHPHLRRGSPTLPV